MKYSAAVMAHIQIINIPDAVEVVSYFNYINRVADALGIDPKPEIVKK